MKSPGPEPTWQTRAGRRPLYNSRYQSTDLLPALVGPSTILQEKALEPIELFVPLYEPRNPIAH